MTLSLIHISEPTRPLYISYAVFCLKNKIQTVKGNSTKFLCGSPGTLFSCKLTTIKLSLWPPGVRELAFRINKKARDSLEIEAVL